MGLSSSWLDRLQVDENGKPQWQNLRDQLDEARSSSSASSDDEVESDAEKSGGGSDDGESGFVHCLIP